MFIFIFLNMFLFVGIGGNTMTQYTEHPSTISQEMANELQMCNASYECSDPFTMNSDMSLDTDMNCACEASYFNTGTCCLTQWWIIGLAAGSGAILLLAFIIAIGCCCCEKSKAKKAKKAAKKAAAHNVSYHHEDAIELEDKERSIEHKAVAVATVAAVREPEPKLHDIPEAVTVSPSAVHLTQAEIPVVSTAGHPAPAPEHHPPVATNATPSEVTHPVAAAATVVAATQNNHHDNPTINQVAHTSPPTTHGTPTHIDPKPNPVENYDHYRQYYYVNSPGQASNPQPAANQYNKYSQPSYPNATNAYFSPNRQSPYGGYSNTQYFDDNDSLETYDDTALPSTNYYSNNYNSGPGYNYNGQHVSSNRTPHADDSNLLNINSASNYAIKRPYVQF